MIRRFFVWLHRWVGLLMTLFLVIVGLTGSLLAFNSELEHIFAPQLFAKPRVGVPPLDLATLVERAAALAPQARVRGVMMPEPDQAYISFIPKVDPATGTPYQLGFTQFFVDPWTGAELGHRRWGDLSEGLINLMPFVYGLHETLLLKRDGALILGVVAVFWTLDCFNGFYLTLPVSLSGFWRRWKPAWLVKWRAGFYRLNFDLHRASGLWLWAAFLVFAWSSVMFNMPSVYGWVTPKIFDYRSVSDFQKDLMRRPAKANPALDWRAAQAVGGRLMAEEAARSGFTFREPHCLFYFAESGLYLYGARRDLFEPSNCGHTDTVVYFDGDTGEVFQLIAPTGEHLGNTITNWLYALHMMRVFGLPYRIFVCLLGLVVAMLSVTGVYIWWKKRRARRLQAQRETTRREGAQIAPAE